MAFIDGRIDTRVRALEQITIEDGFAPIISSAGNRSILCSTQHTFYSSINFLLIHIDQAPIPTSQSHISSLSPHNTFFASARIS